MVYQPARMLPAAELVHHLRAHHPADLEEAESLSQTLALLGAHPDPFTRTAFTPGHLTASALLLSRDGARVGLIWHTKLGRLLQPGGHVEPGDASLWHTALRELCEETGLSGDEVIPLGKAPLDLDVHDIPARGDEGAHRHFDVRYGFRLNHKRNVPPVTWLAPADLPEVNLRRAAAKLTRPRG